MVVMIVDECDGVMIVIVDTVRVRLGWNSWSSLLV